MSMPALSHLAIVVLLGLGALASATEPTGLVDATLVVYPSQIVASGLQKVHGTAVVTVTTDRDYLGRVRYAPEDPGALYRFVRHEIPCDDVSDLWKVWIYECAPRHPNRNVACRFYGIISNCVGTGEPPPFVAQIVHVDLDVDSDNDSDPIADQKVYSRSEEEDAVEFPIEPELPGLVLVTNRGFEEGGFGDGSRPEEDRVREGINPDDQDLSRGILEIRGGQDGMAYLTNQDDLYRIYRLVGGQAVAWRSGEGVMLSPGLHYLRLEGISPGLGTSVITFYPRNFSRGGQPAVDKIRVTVVDPLLAVDRDRDDTVGEGPTDLTWETSRLRFWFNNDRDGSDEDEEPNRPDYDNDRWQITSPPPRGGGPRTTTYRLRDLEDLNRMRLIVRGIDAHLAARRMSVALRWDNDGGGLKLKGYWNADAALGIEYLRDTAAGQRFCMAARLVAEAKSEDQAEVAVGSRSLVPGSGGYHSPWLWDATGTAQRSGGSGTLQRGRLGVVVRAGTGKSARPIAWYRHLHLGLSDARRWYEHDTCGDFTTNHFDGRPHPPRPATDGDYRYSASEPSLWVQESDNYENSVLTRSKDSFLTFIHGYRMHPWERRAFAETMLKRLYWQNYGGRIAFLSWPTEYVSVPIGQVLSPANYDRSEVIARLTGAGLPGWLNDLGIRAGNRSQLVITSHSMGNIVLSSGIRALGGSPVAETYLALQSADVAAAYDPLAGQMTKSESPGFVLGGIQATQPAEVIANALTPDLFRFDQPRLVRPVPGDGLGGMDRLESPGDGATYARSMRTAFTRTVNLYNPVDSATAAAFYSNAWYRVNGDTGYRFRRLRVGEDGFRDDWQGRTDTTNWPDWLGSTIRPIWRSLQWQPEAPADLGRTTERAVILSMLTAPRSRTVGAQTEGLPGFFNVMINGNATLGMTNDDRHHSYEFNLTIQQTWRVWSQLRSQIVRGAP